MSKKNTTRKNNKSTVYYKPRDFSYLLGKVKGIDDELIKMHFKIYQGLVESTNSAVKYIQSNNTKNTVEYSATQKELSFLFNSMRLHEMYFGVMCGNDMDKMDNNLQKDINTYFGSFKSWEKKFMETGSIQGVGFVVLCRDKINGMLFNMWINEYNSGEIIGVDVLLVMDMWEHAYISQFGLDINKYMKTFLSNVNWSIVSELYNHSVVNKFWVIKK